MTAAIPFWTIDGTIDLAALAPEDMTAGILGNTLAKINRFNGRAREPWSVAAHSLLVASLCPPDLRPWALLHDAHEAFIGDMTDPAVEFLCLCGTRSAVEHAIANAKGRLDRLIGAAWKVPVRSMNTALRAADHAALLAEAWHLLGHRPDLPDRSLADAVDRATRFLQDHDALLDWRQARHEWLGHVQLYASRGLMTPPAAHPDPSSMVLSG